MQNNQFLDIQILRSFKNIFLVIAILSFLASCSSAPEKEFKDMDPLTKKAELYYDYGTTALNNRDYTKALTNLKKALEIKNEDTRIHNNLGMAYYFKGDLDKCIKHLKEAIDLDNKNSDAKNNLASVYFYQGSFQKAEELYRDILKDLEYTKQFRTYYNLGLLSLRKNRTNRASELFQRSITENKSFCPAHYQLGQLAFKEHNYHQAANYFQNASLGSCADNPDPHLKEAQSLVNLGEFGKALLKFQDIKERFPDSKEAVLATRKIKSLQINKVREKHEQAALKYELNEIEKNIRKKKKKEQEGKPAEPLEF